VANWTPAVDIGYADYPRLAGGPRGLFLLAGTPTRGLEVRRYNGTTFGPGVALAASGDDAQDHITQDAAGRLHAVFPQGAADGLHLVHATSEDGVTVEVIFSLEPFPRIGPERVSGGALAAPRASRTRSS
jgi:hypothetical protein